MSESTASASGLRVPKLGHKKSMFGCQRCRARRVKVPCVYDRDGRHVKRSPRASDKSSPASSSGEGPYEKRESREWSLDQHFFGAGREGAEDDGDNDPPEGRARRMLEARLMHQYVTETGSSIAIDEVSRDVFARLTPQLAFRSDALLYSIYTIAALHLGKLHDKTDPAAAPVVEPGVAGKYFSMALREHRKEISQLTPDTVDPVCLTSCLMRNYASIQLQDRSRQPYTPPWEWLIVTKSSTTVFAEAWRLVGIEPKSIAFQLIKGTRHIHEPARGISSQNRDSGILKSRDSNNGRGRRCFEHLLDRSLSDGDATPEPWDADIQAAYESAIDYISNILGVIELDGPSGNVCRMLVMFPMLADMRYVDLVRAASPRALVILAHYFALLAEYHEFWWLGDSGVKEVRAIAGELTGRWKELMVWPLNMIEKYSVIG
ncbi:hypothetical protein SLS62_010993 [Diatrype stigma]|uniref:C6 finger domain-containing protein n=1 Tax=Diatrype stigma TaxID=117547 RepID=A0AAN9UEN3_9PEZI